MALLSRTEGIIPAIESAHAVAGALRVAEQLAAEKGPEATVLINLSGRGDKDMGTAMEYFGLGDPERVAAEPVGDVRGAAPVTARGPARGSSCERRPRPSRRPAPTAARPWWATCPPASPTSPAASRRCAPWSTPAATSSRSACPTATR